MPASDFSLWVPAITCLVLLFGVALYLQSKGLQDPAAMVAKSPRLTGVVFILLVGLITSALFASQYKGAKDGGSFMVPEKAIGLGVAISILGIVMVILGPRATDPSPRPGVSPTDVSASGVPRGISFNRIGCVLRVSLANGAAWLAGSSHPLTLKSAA